MKEKIKLKLKVFSCLLLTLPLSFSGATSDSTVDVEEVILLKQERTEVFSKLSESLDTLHSRVKELNELLVRLED